MKAAFPQPRMYRYDWGA